MSMGQCDCVALRERVKKLTEALENLVRANDQRISLIYDGCGPDIYIELWNEAKQALNQDSLGDGGKGE